MDHCDNEILPNQFTPQKLSFSFVDKKYNSSPNWFRVRYDDGPFMFRIPLFVLKRECFKIHHRVFPSNKPIQMDVPLDSAGVCPSVRSMLESIDEYIQENIDNIVPKHCSKSAKIQYISSITRPGLCQSLPESDSDSDKDYGLSNEKNYNNKWKYYHSDHLKVKLVSNGLNGPTIIHFKGDYNPDISLENNPGALSEHIGPGSKMELIVMVNGMWLNQISRHKERLNIKECRLRFEVVAMEVTPKNNGGFDEINLDQFDINKLSITFSGALCDSTTQYYGQVRYDDKPLIFRVPRFVMTRNCLPRKTNLYQISDEARRTMKIPLDDKGVCPVVRNILEQIDDYISQNLDKIIPDKCIHNTAIQLRKRLMYYKCIKRPEIQDHSDGPERISQKKYWNPEHFKAKLEHDSADGKTPTIIHFKDSACTEVFTEENMLELGKRIRRDSIIELVVLISSMWLNQQSRYYYPYEKGQCCGLRIKVLSIEVTNSCGGYEFVGED